MNRQTLWSNTERTRFFLLDDDTPWAVGNYEVVTLTGRSKHVSLEEIAEFEMSRDEAKAWLKSEFGTVVKDIKQSVMQTLIQGREPPPWSAAAKRQKQAGNQQAAKPEAATATADTQTSTAKGFPDLSQIIGQLGHFIGDLGYITEHAMGPDAENLEKAQQRTEQVIDTMRQAGFKVDDQAREIPEKLHDFFERATDAESLNENADHLERLAEGFESIAESIRAMAESLRRQAEDKAPATRSENEAS